MFMEDQEVRTMTTFIPQLKLTSINELIVHFTKIFKEKPKFKPTFKIGEVEFGFIPNLENITFGEYVDLENYLSKWEDFHKAMAVMYRPITIRKEDKYEIMEYTGAAAFSEGMKFAPMDVAISASVFFWTLGSELLSATLDYLTNELKTNGKEFQILAHELSFKLLSKLFFTSISNSLILPFFISTWNHRPMYFKWFVSRPAFNRIYPHLIEHVQTIGG